MTHMITRVTCESDESSAAIDRRTVIRRMARRDARQPSRTPAACETPAAATPRPRLHDVTTRDARVTHERREHGASAHSDVRKRRERRGDRSRNGDPAHGATRRTPAEPHILTRGRRRNFIFQILRGFPKKLYTHCTLSRPFGLRDSQSASSRPRTRCAHLRMSPPTSGVVGRRRPHAPRVVSHREPRR